MPPHNFPYNLHPECCWPYRPEKVAEYADRLRAGEMPPPVVFTKDLLLLDGRHRVEAWLTVHGSVHELPYMTLRDEDPAAYVHRVHQGIRQLTVSEMAEHVKRRMAAGVSEEDCFKLLPDERYKNLIRNALARQAKLVAATATPTGVTRKPRTRVDGSVRVIIPDSHGEHIDPAARDAFLGDLAALNPHEIVMLGDHLDCGGTLSVHQRSYTNELTESYDSDVAATNSFLDAIQAGAPHAKIHYLEGNHEQHVERWATREFANHKDAVKVLDVFGPEAQLRLKARGIPYYRRSEMYMGISLPGTIKLGNCYFTHGTRAPKHSADRYVNDFSGNVVFGHVHRAQSVITRSVASSSFGAWCPGTLAKLQMLYGHTALSGWSHGYGLQFVEAAGDFMHINVPIVNGRSLLPRLLRK